MSLSKNLFCKQILDLAIQSDCQAIHPGYGFLSENSHFASIVTRAGLIFIGPAASAIQAMGSKAESKALMIQAQVPTTPGYNGENQDAHFLLDQAKHLVGFPLLIKATKGGGKFN
jgi:3-methylcrotonyl-CoA carboxylase alpha subunit